MPTVYVCQSLPKDPDQPEGGRTRLFEDVGAGAEEGEEAEVAEDLELLADFVADVAVIRMEFRKGARVSVYVGESEFEFAQGLHDLKHVEGPAAFLYL